VGAEGFHSLLRQEELVSVDRRDAGIFRNQKSASKKTFIDRRFRHRSFCGIFAPAALRCFP
jgi:hypothetical protein